MPSVSDITDKRDSQRSGMYWEIIWCRLNGPILAKYNRFPFLYEISWRNIAIECLRYRVLTAIGLEMGQLDLSTSRELIVSSS